MPPSLTILGGRFGNGESAYQLRLPPFPTHMSSMILQPSSTCHLMWQPLQDR